MKENNRSKTLFSNVKKTKVVQFITKTGLQSPTPQQATILAILQCAFIGVALLSNIFAIRFIEIGGVSFVLGNLLFPVVYILGDLIGELTSVVRVLLLVVVGYIFQLIVFAFVAGGSAIFSVVDGNQIGAQALDVVFGFVPSAVLASFFGVLTGNLVNVVILRGMSATKFSFKTRAFVSTVGGEFFDTWVFLAVLGVSINWINAAIVAAIKIAVEAIVLPATGRAHDAIIRKGTANVLS